MGKVWFPKGSGRVRLFKAPRRTLFELHPGRQDYEIPSNLLLDEMSPEQQPDEEIAFTTSEDLIDALGPIGLQYVNQQEAKGKVDLSYVADPALLVVDRIEAIKEAEKAKEAAKIVRMSGNHRISLKEVLIQYLRHVDPIVQHQARSKNPNLPNKYLDDALLNLFSKGNNRCLHRRGWDVTDLMNWTWILTAETTERAATRLLAVAHLGFTKAGGGRSIPQFIFTFLLRRDPSAAALRSLLIYAWKLLEKSESLRKPLPPLEKLSGETPRGEGLTSTPMVKNPEDDPLGMKETVFIIIILRLLRSALKVFPAACESIVALINRYLDGLNFRKGASQRTTPTLEDTAQLTHAYNTLLKMVSLPAVIGPFQSAFHQQRAQFSLLRRMNQFQPSLIVDRKGYRAVVSMQLRHKKILKEREWAQMKAKSWPPWKEDKLGIDADIGVEHGISRAMEALRRSWEAGYAPDNWDAIASVLSGWDTDGSPTIQTRATLLPHERRTKDSQIWASRIRSTRTLDEAWSCFLTYKDQTSEDVWSSRVYHQMFEKIVQDAKRPATENANPNSTDHPDDQSPLPGDGLEVWAAPESPREAIYVRRPPPTIEEFAEMMAKDQIRPARKFLSTMLSNAPNLESGLRYLEASTMTNAQVSVLCDDKPPATPEAQAALESIPPYMFSAFIELLTRFSPRMPDTRQHEKYDLIQTGLVLDSMMAETECAQLGVLPIPPDSKQFVELPPSTRSIVINPLLRAIQLVLAQKPRDRRPWYHLLRALSAARVVTDVASRFVDQHYQDIKTWQIICRLLNEMLEIDLTLNLEGFNLLCVGLEKAIFASERLSRNQRYSEERSIHGGDMESSVDRALSSGLPLIKELFRDLVRSESMQQEIPVSLTEEISKMDKSVEKQGASEFDEFEDDIEAKSTTESKAFLPPGCLLPRLLEAPHPAYLHRFVRILGLSEDYSGLLDLVEWMSLYADEIKAVADENANGHRIMRRCLTAIHVFMERSWTMIDKREAEARGEDRSTKDDRHEMEDRAPAGIVKAIQDIVEGNKGWGGWPTTDEVEHYCAHGKFPYTPAFY